jgi:hypothetical protein
MLEIKSSKNCVKYTKKTYAFSKEIDHTFVEHFHIFGTPELIEVKKFLPQSNDLVKIRNYDYSFEITAGMTSTNLTAIYKLKDEAAIELVEGELISWIES